MSLVPVPYQDNGCDCGVFVCRYAYNLYMIAWDDFNDAVDTVISSQDYDPGCPLTEDEAAKLNHDGIRAGLAHRHLLPD